MGKCKDCRFSHWNSVDTIACRRYPPTITKADDSQVTSHFPLLNVNMGCGEWKSKRSWYGSMRNT